MDTLHSYIEENHQFKSDSEQQDFETLKLVIKRTSKQNPSDDSNVIDKEIFWDLDVYELLSIRNYLVYCLTKEQRVIERIITKWYTELSDIQRHDQKKSHKERQRVRLWLVVVMTLTNGSRLQGCTKLEVPQLQNAMSYGDKNVVRLVYRGSGLFNRLFFADKVGNKNTPVSIPLGKGLSSYVGSWLCRWRPKTYVFENFDGKEWSDASKQISKYIQLMVPVWLAPNQKALRIFGESAMSILTKFDREKMDLFGVLSRHDVNTIEKNYLQWTKFDRTKENQYTYVRNMTYPNIVDLSVELDSVYGVNNTQQTHSSDSPTLVGLVNIKLKERKSYMLPPMTPLPKCSCGLYVEIIGYEQTNDHIISQCVQCNHEIYIQDNKPINLPDIHIQADFKIEGCSENCSKTSKKQTRTIKHNSSRRCEYSCYIGVDTSTNGLAMSIIKQDKRYVYYWSKKNFSFKDSQSVKFKYIERTNDMLSSFKQVLIETIRTLSLQQIIAAVEAPLPEKTYHSLTQKQFTVSVRNIIKQVVSNTVEVNNLLVKKIWCKYRINGTQHKGKYKRDLSALDKKLLSTHLTPDRKRLLKLKMYIGWLSNEFPGINDMKQNMFDTVIPSHPNTDIVDSMAIAVYLSLADLFGPSESTLADLKSPS